MLGLEVERVEDRAAASRPSRSAMSSRPGGTRTPTGCGLPGRDRPGRGAGGLRRAQCAHRDEGRLRAAGTVIPGTRLDLDRARSGASSPTACSARCARWASEEHEGIIELPEDAPVGAPFARVMGLDDPVIDVAVTPNRPIAPRRARHRPRPRRGRPGRLKPIDAGAGPRRLREPDPRAHRARRGGGPGLPDLRRPARSAA